MIEINWTLIAAVIIGVVIVTGIAFAATAPVAKQTNTIGCGACSGTCNAESNCGLASCGASTGGTCTCGR